MRSIAVWACISAFLVSHSLTAQKLARPVLDPSGPVPSWVEMLCLPDPHVPSIDKAYAEWRDQNPGVRSTWTQYFKKWRRHIDPLIQADGTVRYPDREQILAERKAYEAKHQGMDQRGGSQADWIPLGPFEMWNDAIDGAPKRVSWQVNVYSMDQSTTDPDLLYAGTEGGEVFRSTDRGQNWEPASRTLSSGAITALAIDPLTNAKVLAGDGNSVWRTMDSGGSWTALLTEGQLDVNDIAIHPLNPNIVLVAAGKGFWRSLDGGINWTKVFPEACYDIEFRPGQPDVVYLLKDNPADKRCEFWKSTDAGLSFSVRKTGWFNGNDPARENGGARMTVTPADPDRIYAVLIGQAKAGDNGFIGIYRSNDAGESWTLPNPPAGGPWSQTHPNLAVIDPFTGQGFHQGYYNLGIAASHENADHLLVGHLSLWRSTNGASSFQQMGGYGGSLEWIHPDVQEIRVLGKDSWVCTDGGLNHSTNFFSSHESRTKGITGSDYWGLGQGWNDDILVGGRYHNGNSGYSEGYPEGVHIRLGGAESPTGYVSPGPGRKSYLSDIGGKVIPKTIDKPSTSFPVSLWPNEGYYPAESSDQVWAPDCYEHYWLGEGNSLWKTEDGGSGFRLVKAFDQPGGGRVTQIALCREVPEVMYVFQRNEATWSEGWVWKTTDGGSTWTALSLPPGYKRRLLLTVSATDPDLLWIGYTDGANGQKIHRSVNGGASWQNISSPLLNGESPQTLVHIAGTEGSLLLGTNRSVYYRQGPDGDWVQFNDGLPSSISCNLLRPFYRDGKVRLGAYGKGIWESPLPEKPAVIAQPSVDKKVAYCSRDSFHFDDHSILEHTGVSWNWSFPGGSPSSSSLRAPVVTFGAPGNYTATMTVTGPFGSVSKALDVEVRNECAPDSFPGLALRLEAEGDAAIVREVPDSLHTQLTLSAWVKPDGLQASYAGIVIGTYLGNAFGLNVRDNNQLGYHWPGGAWWWGSGLQVIPGQWNHVALVMDQEGITLYLNGVGATHKTAVQPVPLTNLTIGRYRDWNERSWKGWIDEVCIWGRALSRDEIRESMHLTRTSPQENGLLAYYQFNRTEGPETDRVGARHLQFAGGATRVKSTVPAGAGVSSRKLVDGPGEYVFGETGLTLNFSPGGLYPNGELVLSRIVVGPDVRPDTAGIQDPSYWVWQNFGQAVFDPATDVTFKHIGEVYPGNAADPSTISLFRREWYGEGPEWQLWASASEASAGKDGSVRFEQLQDLGQWSLANGADPVSSVDRYPEGSYPDQWVLFTPNPAQIGGAVRLNTALQGELVLRVVDAKGAVVTMERTRDGQSHPVTWPAGTYFYEVRSKDRMARGTLVTY